LTTALVAQYALKATQGACVQGSAAAALRKLDTKRLNPRAAQRAVEWSACVASRAEPACCRNFRRRRCRLRLSPRRLWASTVLRPGLVRLSPHRETWYRGERGIASGPWPLLKDQEGPSKGPQLALGGENQPDPTPRATRRQRPRRSSARFAAQPRQSTAKARGAVTNWSSLGREPRKRSAFGSRPAHRSSDYKSSKQRRKVRAAPAFGTRFVRVPNYSALRIARYTASQCAETSSKARAVVVAADSKRSITASTSVMRVSRARTLAARLLNSWASTSATLPDQAPPPQEPRGGSSPLIRIAVFSGSRAKCVPKTAVSRRRRASIGDLIGPEMPMLAQAAATVEKAGAGIEVEAGRLQVRVSQRLLAGQAGPMRRPVSESELRPLPIRGAVAPRRNVRRPSHALARAA
jgi:hypothetical protein